MTTTRIVLAAPQHRYDALEQELRIGRGYDVLRVRAPTELTQSTLRAFDPRYVFFAHWSWRIPAEIYSAFECVIFHMSDVPYGRGGSPIQNHIVLGATDTQLSAIRCVDKLDAGPIYLKRPIALHGTVEEILSRAAALVLEMITEITKTQPVPIPQVGEPTIFKRRTPAQGNLAPLTSLVQVYDYIRMLDGDGYPPAFLETENFRFEFTDGQIKSDAVTAQVRIVGKRKDGKP